MLGYEISDSNIDRSYGVYARPVRWPRQCLSFEDDWPCGDEAPDELDAEEYEEECEEDAEWNYQYTDN